MQVHGSFRVKSTTGGSGHLSDLAQINFEGTSICMMNTCKIKNSNLKLF